MTPRPKGSKTVDPVVGSRLVNACWLAASFGGATLQYHLLAQAQASTIAEGAGQYQGTLIACLGIAWLAGQLVGRRLSKQAGRVAWGMSLLGTALAWSASSSPGFAPRLPLVGAVPHQVALAFLAFRLALFSSAWLAKARPWPALGEETRLTASLVAVLAGLCTAWILPAWSGTIGGLLLLPLLSLDLWPAARCPLPEPRRTRAAARHRLGDARPPDGVPPGPAPAQSRLAGWWWWSWLASRRQLSLALLAGGVRVILTSVWLVVPTLYASSLAQGQRQEILLWLLGGQICAVLLGAGALRTRAGRRLLGSSATNAPASSGGAARLAGWGMLLLAAICLAALGNPWIEARWLLGLAIAVYTLAIGAWQRLFPRLLRGTAGEVGKTRPSGAWELHESGGAQDLATMRLARDEFARRSASRWEHAFLMGVTLLTGALCDQWGEGPVLVLAGCVLVGIVAAAQLTARYIDRPTDTLGRPTAGAPGRLQEFPATDALEAVLPASRPPVRLLRGEGRSGGQEPTTTAQPPISIPGVPAEHNTTRYAAQHRRIPLSEEEDDFAHDNNGSDMH